MKNIFSNEIQGGNKVRNSTNISNVCSLRERDSFSLSLSFTKECEIFFLVSMKEQLKQKNTIIFLFGLVFHEITQREGH